MDAGPDGGTLTTRPVAFRGRRLFVNAAVARGRLQVEVLDREGNVIAPFSRDNCMPVTEDRTLLEVRFRGVEDLASLAGKPVRLRFTLNNGSLYSFWVSPDGRGASHGYVAAGGPGFPGAVDETGTESYEAARRITGAKGPGP
jgi:hypothetical protein